MGAAPEPVPHDTLHSPSRHNDFSPLGHRVLPVRRGDTIVGIVTARAVSDALADDDADTLTVDQVVEQPATITATHSVAEASRVLAEADATGLPVVNDLGELAGWLTYNDLLRAVNATGTELVPR